MSITLKTAVVYGLAWLFEIEQPPGAIVPPHGIAVELPDIGRTLGFIPRGQHGSPVIVLSVTRPTWRDGQCLTPLNREEHDTLAAWCERLHRPVYGVWNGHPWDMGCIGLARDPHPSLRAASDRYLAGCPEHRDRDHVCGCPWFSRGHAQVRYPYRFTMIQEVPT